jgi:hypothetical protein
MRIERSQDRAGRAAAVLGEWLATAGAMALLVLALMAIGVAGDERRCQRAPAECATGAEGGR